MKSECRRLAELRSSLSARDPALERYRVVALRGLGGMGVDHPLVDLEREREIAFESLVRRAQRVTVEGLGWVCPQPQPIDGALLEARIG